MNKAPPERFREGEGDKDLRQACYMEDHARMVAMGPIPSDLRCLYCDGLGTISIVQSEQTWAGKQLSGLLSECLGCLGFGIAPIPPCELK